MRAKRWIDDDARARTTFYLVSFWFIVSAAHFFFALTFGFAATFVFMAFHLAMGYAHRLHASLRCAQFTLSTELIFMFVFESVVIVTAVWTEFHNRVRIDIN